MRVGLRPEGRAPMREGVEDLFAEDGTPVGRVTSGGFGPVVNAPIAMGYVARAHAGHRHATDGRGARQAPARHRGTDASFPTHNLQTLRTDR
jgi:glycine cleavage system aminomethyltransferase T